MNEYKPTNQEEYKVNRRYKLHQFKLKWLPFYRKRHIRKLQKQLECVTQAKGTE